MKARYIANVATLKLDKDSCTGCGMCADVCPHNVFAIRNGKAEILDRDLCMECGACAANCPFSALSVNAGVGCAAAIINGLLTGKKPSCGPDDGQGGRSAGGCGCSGGQSGKASDSAPERKSCCS